MNDQYSTGAVMTMPRGTPSLAPMQLDMGPLYDAERRLREVKVVGPGTYKELEGTFNEACNTASKYLAWIEYEMLQAKKYLGLARATVMLDKAPEAYKKIANTGIKFNEDFREALCARDEEYSKCLDTLNGILAVKALLESKYETFKRSYYSCSEVADRKGSIAATPNLTGVIGQTQNPANFMGERRRSNE